MEHARATELFSAYLDRELGAEEIRALEEHLAACEACRAEYETFAKAVSALGAMHKMAAPTQFTDGVRGEIRRRSKGRFFGPRRLAGRFPYEIFSLVMLGVILAVYMLLEVTRPAVKLP